MPYTSRQRTGIDISMGTKRWPWQASSTYGSFYNQDWTRVPLQLLPYYGGYDRYNNLYDKKQTVTSLDYGKFYSPEDDSYLSKKKYLRPKPRHKYGLTMNPAHQWRAHPQMYDTTPPLTTTHMYETTNQSTYKYKPSELDQYNRRHGANDFSRQPAHLPQINSTSPYYKPITPLYESSEQGADRKHIEYASHKGFNNPRTVLPQIKNRSVNTHATHADYDDFHYGSTQLR